MTAPREIIPGRTYLLTRRCTRREFLLRPDARTNQIFQYCLGEAAARFAMQLLAWKAMSNHYHAVVYDPEGQLPAFLEHFHKMLARVLNVRWSRWENLWATEETAVTHLVTASDIFDKVVYVLTNPINDDLVDRVVDWPGSTSLHHLDGRTTRHERPTLFFTVNGSMPPASTLQVNLPPFIAETESFDSWAARVRHAVHAREAACRAERLRTGRRVLGRKSILRASPFASPTSFERRRELRPRVACKNRELRILALRRLVEFQETYRAARERFISGDRDVVFPAGTYRLRAWGVRCAPFPTLRYA